jgi:hypothetical protein
VWGIAKIYDNEAMQEILEGDISTSPSVAFDSNSQNVTLTTEGGKPLLIEGKPFLLDHIAIVTKERGSRGVWDKGGDATGVLLNNKEEIKMDSQEITPVADASGAKLDAILNAISNLAVRVDEMEKKNMPAEPFMKASDEADKEDCMPEKKGEDEVPRKDEGDGIAKMPAGEIKFDEDEDAKMDEYDKEAMKCDEDEAMKADAQAKADSVMSAFGKQASRPLLGESLLAYRKRLLRPLQPYSDAYKSIDLVNAIKDSALLDIVEKQIHNDALQSAKLATHIPAGALYAVKKTDASGRTITSYKGHISAFLDEFKLEPMRATRWFTNNVERN